MKHIKRFNESSEYQSKFFDIEDTLTSLEDNGFEVYFKEEKRDRLFAGQPGPNDKLYYTDNTFFINKKESYKNQNGYLTKQDNRFRFDPLLRNCFFRIKNYLDKQDNISAMIFEYYDSKWIKFYVMPDRKLIRNQSILNLTENAPSMTSIRFSFIEL